MAITKKTRDKCWAGYGERGILVQCWWNLWTDIAIMENAMEEPQKIKNYQSQLWECIQRKQNT